MHASLPPPHFGGPERGHTLGLAPALHSPQPPPRPPPPNGGAHTCWIPASDRARLWMSITIRLRSDLPRSAVGEDEEEALVVARCWSSPSSPSSSPSLGCATNRRLALLLVDTPRVPLLLDPGPSEGPWPLAPCSAALSGGHTSRPQRPRPAGSRAKRSSCMPRAWPSRDSRSAIAAQDLCACVRVLRQLSVPKGLGRHRLCVRPRCWLAAVCRGQKLACPAEQRASPAHAQLVHMYCTCVYNGRGGVELYHCTHTSHSPQAEGRFGRPTLEKRKKPAAHVTVQRRDSAQKPAPLRQGLYNT